VREYVWRRRVRHRGAILHDEGRIAANGRAYIRQWITLPNSAENKQRDWAVTSDFLAASYFRYIQLRFRGLVQVRQFGSSVRIALLDIPLLRLKSGVPAPSQDMPIAAYAITGGLLATDGESGGGRLAVLIHELPEGRVQLVVEVSEYRARLLRLGPASLLYRWTQVRVHRWITFGYLLWYTEQGRHCSSHGEVP